jgi:lipid-binding SYLF domain-containing protein
MDRTFSLEGAALVVMRELLYSENCEAEDIQAKRFAYCLGLSTIDQTAKPKP